MPMDTNGQAPDESDNGNAYPIVRASLRRTNPRFSRNASTQMITYCISSLDQRKVKDLHDVETQTSIFSYSRTKENETAVINADFPQGQPVSDDEIEVVAGGIPRLTEEVQRLSVPPLIEQRQPTPPPGIELDFECEPERKPTPLGEVQVQHGIKPRNDTLVRVGGGWMKENYHEQKHCLVDRKWKPLSDRHPVIPSLFHPSCRLPSSVKKIEMNKSYYASVTVRHRNHYAAFAKRFLDKMRTQKQ